jgi:hypothetical protein
VLYKLFLLFSLGSESSNDCVRPPAADSGSVVVSKLQNYFSTQLWMLPHMFSDGMVLLNCKYSYLCSLCFVFCESFADRCTTHRKSESVSRSTRNTIMNTGVRSRLR